MKNKNLAIRKIVTYLNNPEYDGGFWLPNIQRPFVWDQEQIEKLFDSIMREYPISTMLVWRTRSSIKRRKFIDNYHDGIRLSDFQVPEDTKGKLLVLDGQQRLQSLFIALCGSHEKAELYFSVLSGEKTSADEVRYHFRFMAAERAGFPWIKFKDIVFSNDMPNVLARKLAEREGVQLTGDEENMLISNLWQAHRVFASEEYIGFQELDSVDNPDIYSEDDVVEIFIRANSGGTQLNKSDLLFSLLTASWQDADEAMEELISELNQGGYRFNRDFILKTCLVLLGKGAAYDVRKFRDDQTRQQIIDHWPEISDAIREIRDYLYSSTFIRSDKALPSYLALIPLIYFRYHFPSDWKRTPYVDVYLLRTLLCGAFSGRPDGLIDKCIKRINVDGGFEAYSLFEVIQGDNRNLEVTEDLLLRASYGSKTIHLIFNLWYRQFDYQPAYDGNIPHVDHIFPQSLLKSVKDINPDTGRLSLMRYPAQVRDQIANCMLLTAEENGFQGKCDTPPVEWFKEKPKAYLDMHLIPDDPELWSLHRYEDFVAARKGLILKKLKQVITQLADQARALPEPAADAEGTPATRDQEDIDVAEAPASPRSQRVEVEIPETRPLEADSDDAEASLSRYLRRIAPATKYVAGFRTEDGKEVALDRTTTTITVWTQIVSLDRCDFSPHRKYSNLDTRNSNLNRKNCPALALGNPVLVWKFYDVTELVDFVNWYSAATLEHEIESASEP